MGTSEELTPYGELIAILDALPLLVRETRRQKRQSLRTAAAAAGVGTATFDRVERRTGYDPGLSTVVGLLRWMST